MNGRAPRNRSLGKLVTAASFGDGLVRLTSPDGTISRKVEPEQVAGLVDAGWVEAPGRSRSGG